MRRSKTTTYGQKGGEGPTKGKTMKRYVAKLPGTNQDVFFNSYTVDQPAAVANFYWFNNQWNKNSVSAELQAEWGGVWVVAKRVDPASYLLEFKS